MKIRQRKINSDCKVPEHKTVNANCSLPPEHTKVGMWARGAWPARPDKNASNGENQLL